MTTHINQSINQSIKFFKKYSPLIDRGRKLGEGKKTEKLPWLGFEPQTWKRWIRNGNATVHGVPMGVHLAVSSFRVKVIMSRGVHNLHVLHSFLRDKFYYSYYSAVCQFIASGMPVRIFIFKNRFFFCSLWFFPIVFAENFFIFWKKIYFFYFLFFLVWKGRLILGLGFLFTDPSTTGLSNPTGQQGRLHNPSAISPESDQPGPSSWMFGGWKSVWMEKKSSLSEGQEKRQKHGIIHTDEWWAMQRCVTNNTLA